MCKLKVLVLFRMIEILTLGFISLQHVKILRVTSVKKRNKIFKS